MHLRTGKDSDLQAVGSLHHRSRVAAYAHILSPETLAGSSAGAFGEYWTERWKWEKETNRLTVAEQDDGAIVGFLYLGPTETPGLAELMAIHVEPGLVGTGLGRRLMTTALDQLAEIGAERAVLWVLEENAVARRFYDRSGWSPDGETRIDAINGEPTSQLRYARTL